MKVASFAYTFVAFAYISVLASVAVGRGEPATVMLYHAKGSGWGNACLVGSTQAATAAHNLTPDDDVRYEAEGANGEVTVWSRDDKEDVAIVHLERPLLPFAHVAKKLPESGAPITVVTRDGENSRLVVHGWFFASKGSLILLDALVVSGMSGSCVLNEAGEAFAVVTGRASLSAPGDNVEARPMLVAKSLVGRKL